MTLTKPQIVRAHVGGRSFADVGGLWGTKGEMLTTAVAGGAREATMCDAMPFESEWWSKFDAHCAERGVEGYNKVSHDITLPGTARKLGTFDFVHCTGVLYHVPDIVTATANLVSITREYLLFGSQVIPEKISNEAGELVVPEDQPLILPLLSAENRAILHAHYKSIGVDAENKFLKEGVQFFNHRTYRPTVGPWWWLVTPTYMRSLARFFGLKILDEITSADGRAFTLFSEKC